MKNEELSLREIQEEALKILLKIDEICQKEHLTYYLAYGSLIGAIRENGIIPWDDDIDVMMPRPDYDKLEKYFLDHAAELEPLRLFGPGYTMDYPYAINRISNCDFYVDKENEKDYGLGIFIDLYPLDAMGNSLKEAEKRKRISCRYASLCYLSTREKFTRDNTKSNLKMIIKLPAFWFAKLIGKNYFFRKLSGLSKLQDYSDASYVGCVVWAADDGYKGVFEKKWLGEGKRHAFEGHELMIPDDYDSILRKLYHEYMTPPPENERTGNHYYKAYRRNQS